MYRYLLRKNPCILLYFILAPLRALSAVAVAGALSIAIDFATNGNLTDVWKYVLLFGIYILLDMVIDASDQAVRLRLTRDTMIRLKADAYHSLAHMSYEHFFQRNTADYISNMTTDAETLRGSYFYVLLKMYADFVRFAVALGILVWLSPALGIFVLATSLLQTLVPILYAKRLERLGKIYSDTQERQMKVLKENLSAFHTAKTFHIEQKLEDNYLAVLTETEESRRRMKFTKEWTSSLSYVFNQIAHLGVFLFGAVLVIQDRLTVADIVAASELIVYISYPILWLNGDFADLRTAKIAADKLQAIMDTPEDAGGSEKLPRQGGVLSLRDVGFAYEQHSVLSGVSYDFEQGKKYLIVGASGAGKSTLLNLIAGLRYDYSGTISLSGTDVRQLTKESFTQNICAINQEPFLFDDTVYNNVALYESIPEDRVENVLDRVGLSALVKTLPEGIHASLGENAAKMSGGEKQRVVIARALVRSTPILLLDESTSHLDPETAAEIEQLVLDLENVTVLLVSHNATSIARKSVDEILELRKGSLYEIK